MENTVWLASHKPGNDGLRHWLFLFWVFHLIHFKTKEIKKVPPRSKSSGISRLPFMRLRYAAFWSANRRLWFYRVATWSSLRRCGGGVTIQKWNGSTPFLPTGESKRRFRDGARLGPFFRARFGSSPPKLLSSGLPLRPLELRIALSPQPHDRDRAHPRPRGAPSIAGPPPRRRRRRRGG